MRTYKHGVSLHHRYIHRNPDCLSNGFQHETLILCHKIVDRLILETQPTSKRYSGVAMEN